MARKQSAHALLPMTKGRPADAERPPAVPFVGEGDKRQSDLALGHIAEVAARTVHGHFFDPPEHCSLILSKTFQPLLDSPFIMSDKSKMFICVYELGGGVGL